MDPLDLMVLKKHLKKILKNKIFKNKMENYFKYFDKNLINNLSEKLDDKDLFKLCQTDKWFNKKICKDENFWKIRIKLKYPKLEIFKKEKETFHSFYIKMVYYIAKLKEEYNFDYMTDFSSGEESNSPEDLYKTLQEIRNIMIQELKMDYDGNVSDEEQEKIINFNKNNISSAVIEMYKSVNLYDLRKFPVDRTNENMYSPYVNFYRDFLYDFLIEDEDF